MATTQPVLNLSTITEPRFVRIDGQPYPLLPPNALSIVDYDRVLRLLPRLEVLWNAKVPLTTQEEDELNGVFRSLCEIVLKAPAEVHARLTDMQRVSIYQAFLMLPQTSPQLLAATGRNGRGGNPRTTSTGATSSRGSRGSMGATRSPGSRKSRTALSGRVSS